MSNLTGKAIKYSFIKLLNEKPLAQITVKNIVEDCGINRNSFYYHYADIPALIEELLSDIIDDLMKKYPTINSIEEGFIVAAKFAVENKRAMYHIYNSVNRDVFEKYLMRECDYVVRSYAEKLFAEGNLSDNDKRLLINYHKYMCFGAIIDWMEGGMSQDLEADISRIAQLIFMPTLEAIKNSNNK